MDKPGERRESVRMPFVSEAICRVYGVESDYCGILRDVSITGLFMEVDGCPSVGHHCTVDIIFAGRHSRLKIEEVRGVIVRSDKDGVAIRFDQRLEWFVLIPLYFHKVHDQPVQNA